MWCICCGMYRSASTWTYQITADLVEKYLNGERIGFKTADQLAGIYSAYNETSNTKVVKIHHPSNLLISLIRSSKYRIIYSHRDVRDVAVSLMRKYDRTFKYLVYDSGQLDEAVQDYYRWTALDSMLICTYKDIMTDPYSVVASIADHLMIELSGSEIRKLVEKYSRERQIERIKRFKNSFEYMLLKQLNTIISFAQKRHFSILERFASKIVGGLGYRGHIRDTSSELHPNHIQSGQIGEWKEFFDPTEKEVLTERYFEWLVEAGYESLNSSTFHLP